MKYRITIVYTFCFMFGTLVSSAQDITTKDLEKHITYLASDELEGRKPGTPGGLLAAEYIRDQFEEMGLQLLGDNGFQYFEVVTHVELGPQNSFKFNDYTGEAGVDFIPYSFSENQVLETDIVFTGYGFEIDSDSIIWNDYEGVDVAGRWVMVLRGDPELDDPNSVFAQYSGARGKALRARDNGAAGILLVTPVQMNKEDDLTKMNYDKSTSRSGIPVINIKREVADEILSSAAKTIEELENSLNEDRKPSSFSVPVVLKASTEVIQKKESTQNVVAMLEGQDDMLRNEYILVGAHYDHLGMGGPGSGSRAIDTIAVHNGADDNASGVAGMMEIAEKMAQGGIEVKRSIIFIAFGAEEMGLLGSKYFTRNPYIDLDDVSSMFNFDMIGRLRPEEKALMIGGTGTSEESVAILDNYKEELDFSLAYSSEGFGASDHASFYGQDIPVFFITTGAHEDYHTPVDDSDRINYQGSKDVCDFSYELILEIANRENALAFQEAGPKERPGGGRSGFKVVLGIMPDFASQENNGLGVDAVREGGPGARGGMLKGDRIVALDGKTVTNIYDYMTRLKELKSGQTITVDVIRNEEKVVLIIQL